MSAQDEYGIDGQPKTDSAGQEPQGQDAVQPDAQTDSIDPVAALLAQIQELEQRNAEAADQVLRARAEADNARRRAQDDVAKARKFGIESFAESLVPVKDSLEAALAAKDQTPETWEEGVQVTLRQLITAFERHQLLEIAPQPGDKFDPHHHQAISSIPAEQPSNTVVHTLQKGYLIAERVLRPALVTVAA